MPGASYGRVGDGAHDNLGMRYEAVLDGKSLWLCANPKCGKRCIDPDGAQQYCSKTCMNAATSGTHGVPNLSFQQRAVQSLARDKKWVQGARASGYIRSLDARPPGIMAASGQSSFVRPVRQDHSALAQPIKATLSSVKRLGFERKTF